MLDTALPGALKLESEKQALSRAEGQLPFLQRKGNQARPSRLSQEKGRSSWQR